VHKLAESDGLMFADLNTPVVASLQKAKDLDPALAVKLLPDRVHPSPGGHLLMAAALLKAWNAPALVTDVEIDGAAGSLRHAENSAVTAVSLANGTLSWTELDGALPMPLDPKDPLLALALRSSDFVDTLDREPLRVTGLTGGSYQLSIDGEPVGTFSNTQFADGINLATLPTPMAEQAAQVHALTLKHNDIHNTGWHTAVSLEKEPLTTLAAAAEAFDRLDAELVSDQRLTAQPKPHRFELARQ
ncbi:MAG: GDSL family lipase, partial [Bryobacteraceae bacterium]